jgi:hypothetical protein
MLAPTMDYATEYSIRRLIHASAELQDQGRIEELARLFRHGEIVLAGVGQVFRGEHGALDVLRRTIFYDANGEPADPGVVYATPRSIHYISNVDVYDGMDGEPGATSRFMIFQQRPAGPHPVIGGRFLDTFVRIETTYWFRRRVAEVHLLGDSVGYLTANPWTA